MSSFRLLQQLRLFYVLVDIPTRVCIDAKWYRGKKNEEQYIGSHIEREKYETWNMKWRTRRQISSCSSSVLVRSSSINNVHVHVHVFFFFLFFFLFFLFLSPGCFSFKFSVISVPYRLPFSIHHPPSTVLYFSLSIATLADPEATPVPKRRLILFALLRGFSDSIPGVV